MAKCVSEIFTFSMFSPLLTLIFYGIELNNKEIILIGVKFACYLYEGVFNRSDRESIEHSERKNKNEK